MEIPQVVNLIPMIGESTKRGERAIDIYERLLRDRIVFLGTPMDDNVANLAIGQLLFLDNEDPEKEIRLYINSPGGVVYSGLAIYDAIQQVKSGVATFCMGSAAGMATLLLAGGTPGKRYSLPNARIEMVAGSGFLLDQPAFETADGVHPQLVTVNTTLARHSGQPMARIEADSREGLVLSPDDAVAYGLIDTVLDATAIMNLSAS